MTTGFICKGSYALGTGCGQCSKCKEEEARGMKNELPPQVNTTANEQQVGGKHYQASYQHWDLVADTGMNYFEGQATKYIVRWRKKNGLEDLRKAVHYINKMLELWEERRIPVSLRRACAQDRLARFSEASFLEWPEQEWIVTAVYAVTTLQWRNLRWRIQEFIDEQQKNLRF